MASYAGSAIQGAGTGAAMGSVAGPWGAAIGGGLGLMAGIFSAYDAEQDAKKKRQILEDAKKQFNLTQNDIDALMQEYYSNPDNFLGTKEDVEAYRQAIESYNPSDFVYDFDEFSYDKSVDDFVNPYYDRIIQDTSDTVQHSAAGAGVGRGTGAANAIADAVAKKNDELYKTALQEYNTDRSQKYSEWSGNIDKMQQRLNQLKSATDTQIGLKGNLAQDYLTTQQQAMADQIASKQNRNNGNLQLASMGLMI